MTKPELINLIINSPTINATLDKTQPEHLRDDFRQFFYLQILEVSEAKLLEVNARGNDAIIKYAGQVIKNQLKSNTSAFYRQYRKSDLQNDYILSNADQNDFKANSGHFIDPDNDELTQRAATERKEDNQYRQIILMLNHIHPKKSKLFLEYWVNGKTYNQIAKQYKIKYTTVYRSIKTTEKEIRTRLLNQ